MAWTTPITATANTAFAAADFNASVRDNLLETEPGVTGSFTNGSLVTKRNTNLIGMMTPSSGQVTTEQSTTSTSYTNLATSGPTISVYTGTTALVHWHASMRNNGGSSSYVSIQITNQSGTITHATSDTYALRHADLSATNGEGMFGMTYLFTGLTDNINTFQLKYRVAGGTGTFRNRRVIVIPF